MPPDLREFGQYAGLDDQMNGRDLEEEEGEEPQLEDRVKGNISPFSRSRLQKQAVEEMHSFG